jgi:hypothetical protein
MIHFEKNYKNIKNYVLINTKLKSLKLNIILVAYFQPVKRLKYDWRLHERCRINPL